MRYASQNERSGFKGTRQERAKISSLQSKSKKLGIDLDVNYKGSDFKFLNTKSSVKRAISNLEKGIKAKEIANRKKERLVKKAEVLQDKKKKFITKKIGKANTEAFQHDRDIQKIKDMKSRREGKGRLEGYREMKDLFDSFDEDFRGMDDIEIKKYIKDNAPKQVERTLENNIINLRLKSSTFFDRYFQSISDVEGERIDKIKKMFYNGELEKFEIIYEKITDDDFKNQWKDYGETTDFNQIDKFDEMVRRLEEVEKFIRQRFD